MSGTVRRRRGALALVALLAISATACTHETDGDGRVAQSAPIERRACAVDVPAQWRDAIAGSAVDTGGLTTTARAVSPAGEVVAVRDSGDAHDLLLIGTDKSVRELYAVREPDVFVIGDVEIDDRWVVFAVVRHPRNANGVLPQVKRIELIDRKTGARSTVAGQSDADAALSPERNVLDPFTLFDGKVYWITRDEYNGENGVAHSFDPQTGHRTDIASGPIRDLQTGPEWSGTPATVPPEVAGLPAAALGSLGTDGTAFGWVSTVADGNAEISYWSPQTGVVKVGGVDVDAATFSKPVLVFDSLVILDAGGSTTFLGSSATVVDTRSGAVARLTPRNPGQYDRPMAAMGGTLALALWAGAPRGPKQADYEVGVLRTGALNSPAC